MAFYVYFLASQRNGTIYIGSIDDLINRVMRHKEGLHPGFTARYGAVMLVYCEQHDTRDDAFRRERQMKKWNRAWKIGLIERFNPGWRDLLDDLL